jgi:hypothetical protein
MRAFQLLLTLWALVRSAAAAAEAAAAMSTSTTSTSSGSIEIEAMESGQPRQLLGGNRGVDGPGGKAAEEKEEGSLLELHRRGLGAKKKTFGGGGGTSSKAKKKKKSKPTDRSTSSIDAIHASPQPPQTRLSGLVWGRRGGGEE